MFKVNIQNTRILSLSADLFINFECSLSINLVFLLLTLGRYVPVGERPKQQQLSKLIVMFWENHKITVCLSIVTDKKLRTFAAGNYILKVNNRNTRTRCEVCSKLTAYSSVSIVNVEQVNAGWGVKGNIHIFQTH